VLLLREYLARLRRAVVDGDVSAKRLLGPTALPRLVDAVLLGTASERVVEHLRLCCPEEAEDKQFMTHGQLQDAFYVLFEPEVAAARAMLGTDRAGWRQVRSPDISGWADPRLFEPDSLRTRGGP
jgi:hypothetical protein